jgi:head protein|uniref:Head protein n=1 Tax=Podoviridae sp. ctrfz10 TaxID=2827749 RepID=A0A8S5T9H0_9CAUD|nr:MAG TPA: Head protein [Podoviridae sp. ctrfz10]
MPAPKYQGATNAQIINTLRANGSFDFQRRIPEATQSNFVELGKNILRDPLIRNEFVTNLVNVVSTIYIDGARPWTNKLSEFKRATLDYGGKIEDIYVGLIEAEHWYNNREYGTEIFRRRLPRIESTYYHTNREDMYQISISEAMMRRAMLSSGGLGDLVSQIMQAPVTSDNWDEFLLMASLLREHYANGGFTKIQVPDVTTPAAGETEAKKLIKAIRTTADKLVYLSEKYNPLNLPTWSNTEDMILFITPEAAATIDVDALAAMFNMEKGRIDYRIIKVPADYIGIPKMQAILVDKKFFVCGDVLYENRSFANPMGLYENFWLHHHEIIGASLFANAVLFTAEEVQTATVDHGKITAITAINVTDIAEKAVTKVAPGFLYLLNAVATRTGGSEFDQHGILWSVAGNTDPRTVVTQDGVLFIGAEEETKKLAVTAKAAADPKVTFSADIAIDTDAGKVKWPK